MLRSLSYLLIALIVNVTMIAKVFSQNLLGSEGVAATPSHVVNHPVKQRLTVGLALGGGGTRGAAHIGVLRVLEQEGIPIDYIAGTSMGAIVGGLYSAGLSIDAIEKKFTDRSLMRAFMTVPLSVRLMASPILILPRMLGRHPYDGLYRGNRFRRYINNAVPECDRKVEELKKPFCAVAVNLVDGNVCSICKGNLGYALQASSAVPELRKPVQIEDKLFVDGGVLANLPVKQVRQMGADIVIAVDVDERLRAVPLDTFRAMGSVSKRLVTVQLATIDEPQATNADIVIHPDVDGIGLISTKLIDAKKALAAGEKAAREAMSSIRAKVTDLGLVGAYKGEK